MKTCSITVNGIQVFHNKTVSDISGDVVTFSDGSWCDVNSGTIINKGQGCLSIGIPPELTAKPVSWAFTATSLVVDGVRTNVDINPIDDTEMRVTFSEPSPGVEVRCIGGVLSITSRGDVPQGCVVGDGAFASGPGATAVGAGAVHVAGHNHGNINTGGGAYIGGTVSVRGDFVGGNFYRGDKIGCGRPTSVTKPTITIGVPKGTPITVWDVDGNVTIGDVGGSLIARTRTKGSTISAGTISGATLEVRVYGSITIQKLYENVRLGMVGEVTLSTEGESRLNMWRLRQKTTGLTVWGEAEGTTIKLTGK
jgi:hypothetical protein